MLRTRQELENIEERTLAPYAMASRASRGRRFPRLMRLTGLRHVPDMGHVRVWAFYRRDIGRRCRRFVCRTGDM